MRRFSAGLLRLTPHACRLTVKNGRRLRLHEELQAAWRGVIRRGLATNELTALGRMPLTEAGALQLARNEWNNPTQRNLKKIEWQTWAQEKYRRLR